MTPYFTRERFGRPQFLAALLLLAFLLQALWLVHRELSVASLPESDEALRIGEGWKQWHGKGIAAAPISDLAASALGSNGMAEMAGYDTERSPLLYLASAGPLLAWPHDLTPDTARYWRWLPRIPFLASGMFLGASLWYVARRLCGNAGGFVALTFYCFSPSLIQASAVWHTQPGIVAAWGAFGTIFTAIAVAHTLYAPREVVLWNWRRIVLLGVALAIAVGSQFSLVVVVPMALAFLLYVAPVRRASGVVIWISSCVIGFVLLLATYFFHVPSFLASMRHSDFVDGSWRSFTYFAVYRHVAMQIARACPGLTLALPVAIVTYALWRRTRYFGNTASLLVMVVFILLGIADPHTLGGGFVLAAVPFMFVFISGVLADLMETKYRQLMVASVWALLITYIARTLMALAQVPRG